MMTTVITRNPPKSTLQLHKPVFWLSSKYYVNENFDVFNWVWDGTVVRLPRAEAKLLSGRGGEGAKKYSAPPPSNISTSMGVNLASFKFSINRQASFESYRTTIQLLWSIPNITLVPNPHPHTDTKAIFKVPAAPFSVDRVSRLLSTNRNLYFVLILIQTRMQQKIRLRWTLTHCLRTGNWT